MLLKGKGPGGIAPAFLNLGSDLDDGSSPNKNASIPISTSVDSDDDGKFFIAFYIGFSEIDCDEERYVKNRCDYHELQSTETQFDFKRTILVPILFRVNGISVVPVVEQYCKFK